MSDPTLSDYARDFLMQTQRVADIASEVADHVQKLVDLLPEIQRGRHRIAVPIRRPDRKSDS